MADDAFNNPFASLKKNHFPSGKTEPGSRGQTASGRTSKHAQSARPAPPSGKAPQPAPSTPPEDDAALFLDAVRFIRPLAARRNDMDEQAKAVRQPLLESLPTTSADKAVAAVQVSQSLPVSAPPVTRAAAKALSESEPEPDAELADFAAAMRHVAPLEGKGRAVPQDVPAPPMPLAPLPEDDSAWTFAVNSNGAYVEGHLLGLDLLLVGKLQAGQFKPEAHLDMHGLTAQQAFHTLVHFLRAAYTKDQRAVLIVSGQGRNSPAGMSVLREKIQDWLVQEPLRRVVLAFCSAGPTDGGNGALYVLLRRFRKDRRPIYWDRHPVDPDLIWGTEPS